MKCTLVSVTVLILAIATAADVSAQSTEKIRLLSEFESVFGKPVDKELNLFEVNKDFILQVDFTGDGLERVSVMPKYYLRETHTEWEEPDALPTIKLSFFQDLVKKVETIRPKGPLVDEGSIGLCSNSRCWFQNFYEDAFLEYAAYGRDKVSSFFISFFQPVTGKIVSKGIRTKRDGITIVYTVTIATDDDDISHRYYVRQDAYNKVRKGEVQTFEAAFVN